MSGPFRSISTARSVGASTSFQLRGARERYYLVWITELDHVAHVNEVRAFS